MRKHMFTIRWVREGRKTRPSRDGYMTCLWPLSPEDASKGMGEAFLTMIDGVQNLPKEVLAFMDAYKWMVLRMTYNSGDITGVYVLDDETEVWRVDDIDSWISKATNEQLARARFEGGVRPIRRN